MLTDCLCTPFWVVKYTSPNDFQWRQEGVGQKGHAPRAALCSGRHLEERKYGILKFGRFWWIGVCIADIITSPNTPPILGPHPNCQCSITPHWAVCTPTNLHCWSDWSFACCKTVEDRYCPVTVFLAIAIQCFALFTRFQILRKIRKCCMKFGQLIPRKIFKFVSTRCQIQFSFPARYWRSPSPTVLSCQTHGRW